MSDKNDKIRELLKKSSALGSLSDSELDDLFESAAVRRFNNNDLVTCQGEMGNSFFIISSGRVKLFSITWSGEVRDAATLKGGDFLGSESYLSKMPRSFYARVVSGSAVLYEIGRQGFEKFRTKHSRLCDPIQEAIREIATKEADEVRRITVDNLSRVTIFRGLEYGEIEQVVKLMTCETYEKGDFLFCDEDTPDGAYLIHHGLVRLFEIDSEGRGRPLGTLGSGDFIGERELICQADHDANAGVISDIVTVYKISSSEFSDFLNGHPRLGRHFDKISRNEIQPEYTRAIEEVRESLRALPLFATLEAADIGKLVGLVARVANARGEVICREGEKSDAAYLIISGVVKVYSVTPDNKQITFATLTRGDFFGERGIIKNEPRSASVRATSEAVTLGAIFKHDFEKLLQENPHLQTHFSKVIKEEATTNYLRVLVLNFLRKRFAVLILSLIVLGFAVTFYPFNRQGEMLISSTSETDLPPLVSVGEFRTRSITVSWTGYGNVEAERQIVLKAPFPGRIARATLKYPGQSFPAHTPLFEFDTTAIRLKLENLRSQLSELSLAESRIEKELEELQRQIQSAKRSVDLAEQALSARKELVEIHERAYERAKNLFDDKGITESEYARNEAAYWQSKLALVKEQSVLREALDSNQRLLHLATLKSLEFDRLPIQREQLQGRINEFEHDLSKSFLDLPYHSYSRDVMAAEGEEVVPGEPLATVYTIDSITISLNLPSSQFEWLYEGSLLSRYSLDGDIDISFNIKLVNVGFSRTYTDGYLKSVGKFVHVPSRSLPIIIARDNPVDENGEILLEESLFPGMYCAVDIPLCELDDVYVVPRRALQEDGRLYHLQGANRHSQRLTFINSVHILREINEGVVVKIADKYPKLLLITHPFPDAVDGKAVRCRLTKGTIESGIPGVNESVVHTD